MLRRPIIFATVLALCGTPLAAQVGPYPAFQPTRVAEREYNFVLADFQGGTAVVFQWREALSGARSQFTAEFGMADFGADAALLLGGSFHLQLTRATDDLPFDMVLGGGMGVTLINDASIFLIPFGVAIGHRFPLEGAFAITPYVHPRLTFASVNGNSDADISFDLGGNFEINSQMQLRLAATLGGFDAVGLSFAWLPRGLRR
ncbi:MAG: hypothetical protein WD771_02360 [Gemmatimonadaceae bacterium]